MVFDFNILAFLIAVIGSIVLALSGMDLSLGAMGKRNGF